MYKTEFALLIGALFFVAFIAVLGLMYSPFITICFLIIMGILFKLAK